MALRLILLSVLLVVICYSPILVDSQSWWSLGVTGCATPGGTCNTCASLQNSSIITDDQLRQCIADSTPVQAIARGARRAIIECQRIFEFSSWNCSTFGGNFLFGAFVVNDHTRETAVLNALLTAGATNAIAEACQEQRIPACPCVVTETPSRDAEGNVILTACSDNYEWARNYISNFLSSSNTANLDSRVDQHNINVGSRAVSTFERTCRCHGLSGSCTVQTCYERTLNADDVGETLFEEYGGAVRVDLVNNALVNTNAQADPLGEGDLAFVDASPNFCDPQPEIGVLGTKGRLCDPSPSSPRSCQILCCSRGYSTFTFQVPVQECRFVYCCKIVCSIVRNDTVVEYRCN